MRIQAALDSVEQRLEETGDRGQMAFNQMLQGSAAEEKTVGGAFARFGLGLLPGFDTAMDVQDLRYDSAHRDEVSNWQLAMDYAGLIPVFGEVADAGKALRNLGRAAEALDTGGDTTRTLNQLEDAAEALKAADNMGEALDTGGDILNEARRAGLAAGEAAAATAKNSATAAEVGIDMSRAALREQRKAELLATITNQLYENSIEIDELTPCLRRTSDGAIVNTTTNDIMPTKSQFQDWEFDWTIPAKDGFTVRALRADGDERIQGLLAFRPEPRSKAVFVELVESAPFNNAHNKIFSGKDYTGVGGHLFAEAVKESYDQGFGGFIYFRAKTDLIEYYQSELGATLWNPRERIMAIDERSAVQLYARYYPEG